VVKLHARCYDAAAMPRGPGPVAAVHRLLIVTALVAALVFVVWELLELRRTGSPAVAVGLVLAVGAAIGLALYLRRLRTRLRLKLTPRA
jgi:hypothetical protein